MFSQTHIQAQPLAVRLPWASDGFWGAHFLPLTFTVKLKISMQWLMNQINICPLREHIFPRLSSVLG